MLKKILNWILGVEESDRTDVLQGIERAEKAEVDTAMDEVMTLKEMPPVTSIKKPIKKKKVVKKTTKKPAKKKSVKKKTKKVTKKPAKKKPTKKAVKKTTKKLVKKKTAKKKTKKTTKKTVKKKMTKKESVVAFLKSSKAPKSIDAIAKKVGITTQTARRYLFYLKKEGKANTKNSGWVSK